MCPVIVQGIDNRSIIGNYGLLLSPVPSPSPPVRVWARDYMYLSLTIQKQSRNSQDIVQRLFTLYLRKQYLCNTRVPNTAERIYLTFRKLRNLSNIVLVMKSESLKTASHLVSKRSTIASPVYRSSLRPPC